MSEHIAEKAFADRIVELAHTFGWRIAHFGSSATGTPGKYRTPCRYDGKGFPDLVLVHPVGGVLFRELKAGARPNRALDPEQGDWQVALAAARADVGVWVPSDWPQIVAELSGGMARVA